MVNFDDPKPAREKRKMQQIFILPSVRDRVDRIRGKVSRSVWIEQAILAHLKALERPPPTVAPDTERPWIDSP